MPKLMWRKAAANTGIDSEPVKSPRTAALDHARTPRVGPSITQDIV